MKNTPKEIAALVMAFTLLFLSSAMASETKTDDALVVTATMTEKSVKEAPGSVEMITRQDLEDMNAQTLADAVENAAGLVVTMETGRNMRPSIRGTGTKHALVLIDGRRLAPGFKSFTGMEQIPVDMIDHIEVLRGPGSALYGSDAIGGVVNVITRKIPDTMTLEAAGEVGQSTYSQGDLRMGRALVGTKTGTVGFLLSGSIRNKDGYDRDGVTPDDGDDIQLGAVAGRMSWDISKTHQLLTGFEYLEKNAKGLRDMEKKDRERDANDDRLNLFAEYNGTLTPVSNLMVRVNHASHKTDIDIDPPTSNITGAIGDEKHSQRQLNQLEARFTSLFFDRHMITAGVEGREVSREDDDGLDHDITNLSCLLQDEYQVTDKLYLLFGGRVDKHSDFGGQFTPRVSATYSVMDNFRIKASAGKGFRAPDLNELYIHVYMKRGKEIYRPNRDLDPETSTSFELSLEGELKTFHGRISGFQTNIDDLIEPVFDYSKGSGKKKISYYTYQNITQARMRGVELEAGMGLPMGVKLSGTLTWMDAENRDTGKDLENRPDIIGSVKLAYSNTDMGLKANLRLNHTGERKSGNDTIKPLTWADFRISKTLFKQMELYAGVNNIANAYTDRGTQSLEPTFFYTGVSIRY